jgi:hypothetical protein
LISFSIAFTLFVSVYSLSYLGVSEDKVELKPKIQTYLSPKFMPFQMIGWSPTDLSNLVDFSTLI